jgi:hypothetical protein
MVVQVYNPRTQETEQVDCEFKTSLSYIVDVRPGLHSKFQVSLDYVVNPCLNPTSLPIYIL